MSSQIAVVGGVYRESCRFPIFDDVIWGSGGRAAAVVAGFGLSPTLYAALNEPTANHLACLACNFGFKLKTTPATVIYQFCYEHGLSSPTVQPPGFEQDRVIQVEAESALVFGMLESGSDVYAEKVVFDPQNPQFPKPFKPGNGTTPRIAYVLNATEAITLSQADSLHEAGLAIMSNHGAEVVVIKCGVRGALVITKDTCEKIAAYRTPKVWSIGSGDVFSAVFAVKWAVEGLPPGQAAKLASRATALYVNDRVLPIRDEDISLYTKYQFPEQVIEETPLDSAEFHVYLAGPFFNTTQRWLIEESLQALTGMGLKVFSPLHDVGIGCAHDIAPKDIEGLKASRTVLALIDGLDTGTVFEVGFARAISLPVIVLAESTTEFPLKMMAGTGCDITTDFVTAIHHTAWAALS